MKKTETTKIKQMRKIIGLVVSSVLETIWAIGVAIMSGQLVT